MGTMRCLSAALLPSMLLFACATNGAPRAAFAAKFSCAPARVEVRERPDVDPKWAASQLIGTAPAEIAGDRIRLAAWRAAEIRRWQGRLDHRATYEIEGCGTHAMAYCEPGASGPDACAWPAADAPAPSAPAPGPVRGDGE
jgi:hypothetical protein